MSVIVTALSAIILLQFSFIVFLMTGRDEGHGKLSRDNRADAVGPRAGDDAESVADGFLGHHASIAKALLSRANASNFHSAINSLPHILASNKSSEIFEGVAVTTFLGGPKVRNEKGRITLSSRMWSILCCSQPPSLHIRLIVDQLTDSLIHLFR